MHNPAEHEARLWIRADASEPEYLVAGIGACAVYSAPAPGYDGRINEDGAAVLLHPGGGVVLAVADGVGGGPSGAEAAEAALSEIRDSVTSSPADPSGFLRGAILNGLEAANRKVRKLNGAACTLAVAEIYQGVARSYHVGDATVLLVSQRGLIRHQSISHGPVGYGVEAGLIDGDEALGHEELNVVSNVVGSANMRIEVGPKLSMKPWDTVLVASDGLTDNLYLDELVQGVRTKSLPLCSRALVERALTRMTSPGPNDPSKPDDLTFVLYRRRRHAT